MTGHDIEDDLGGSSFFYFLPLKQGEEVVLMKNDDYCKGRLYNSKS